MCHCYRRSPRAHEAVAARYLRAEHLSNSHSASAFPACHTRLTGALAPLERRSEAAAIPTGVRAPAAGRLRARCGHAQCGHARDTIHTPTRALSVPYLGGGRSAGELSEWHTCYLFLAPEFVGAIFSYTLRRQSWEMPGCSWVAARRADVSLSGEQLSTAACAPDFDTPLRPWIPAQVAAVLFFQKIFLLIK